MQYIQHGALLYTIVPFYGSLNAKEWGDHIDCTFTITCDHKVSSGNLVCLLPGMLIDCSSLTVYCCWADSSIINRPKWTPDLCKPASGEHSVCCCVQLLISIQQTAASLSSLCPVPRLQAKIRTKQNALILFQMFCISILVFPTSPQCILLVSYYISWIVFI